jgi:NADH-quinone oxidoreductase E subunit
MATVLEDQVKLSKEELAKLDKIIEKNKGQNGVLINVLHEAQQLLGYLPREIQVRVARGLDIPFSKVYSVVSFYSLFSTNPRGKYTIEVCTGTACYVKGADDVLKELKSELQIEPGETTEDKIFTLETTRCVGACGMAPVVIIGDNAHGRVKPEDVPELLDKYE